ncbi:Hypothetical predicted protein, partial [Cloeon dipterum]
KFTGGTCCLHVVKQLAEEVENRRETEFGRLFHKRRPQRTPHPHHPDTVEYLNYVKREMSCKLHACSGSGGWKLHHSICDQRSQKKLKKGM